MYTNMFLGTKTAAWSKKYKIPFCVFLAEFDSAEDHVVLKPTYE